MDKNKGVKYWFDEKEDIFYLSLKEGEVVDSEAIAENIRVEYNEKGEVVAIEIFNISKMIASSLAKKLSEQIVKRQV